MDNQLHFSSVIHIYPHVCVCINSLRLSREITTNANVNWDDGKNVIMGFFRRGGGGGGSSHKWMYSQCVWFFFSYKIIWHQHQFMCQSAAMRCWESFHVSVANFTHESIEANSETQWKLFENLFSHLNAFWECFQEIFFRKVSAKFSRGVTIRDSKKKLLIKFKKQFKLRVCLFTRNNSFSLLPRWNKVMHTFITASHNPPKAI